MMTNEANLDGKIYRYRSQKLSHLKILISPFNSLLISSWLFEFQTVSATIQQKAAIDLES